MKDFFEYREELNEGPAYRKRYTSSSGNIRLNTSASRKGVGASVSLRSSNSTGLGWNYNVNSGRMTIALRGTGLRWDFGGSTGRMAEIRKNAKIKVTQEAEKKLASLYEKILKNLSKKYVDPVEYLYKEVEEIAESPSLSKITSFISKNSDLRSALSLIESSGKFPREFYDLPLNKKIVGLGTRGVKKLDSHASFESAIAQMGYTLEKVSVGKNVVVSKGLLGTKKTRQDKNRYGSGSNSAHGGIEFYLSPKKYIADRKTLKNVSNDVQGNLESMSLILLVSEATEGITKQGVSWLEKNKQKTSAQIFLKIATNQQKGVQSLVRSEIGVIGGAKPSFVIEGELVSLVKSVLVSAEGEGDNTEVIDAVSNATGIKSTIDSKETLEMKEILSSAAEINRKITSNVKTLEAHIHAIPSDRGLDGKGNLKPDSYGVRKNKEGMLKYVKDISKMSSLYYQSFSQGLDPFKTYTNKDIKQANKALFSLEKVYSDLTVDKVNAAAGDFNSISKIIKNTGKAIASAGLLLVPMLSKKVKQKHTNLSDIQLENLISEFESLDFVIEDRDFFQYRQRR